MVILKNIARTKKNMSKRRMRNFLVEPSLQLKVFLISMFNSLVFATTLITVFYLQTNTVANQSESPFAMPHIGEIATGPNLIVFIAAFLVCAVNNFILVVVFTHRIAGAAYALRRRIGEITRGRYEGEVRLRKHDFLKEVADDLNVLSSTLASDSSRSVIDEYQDQPIAN